jgi:hypothetical protein
VVFEAKYFSQGGVDRAASELVRGIYQAFFYRALPAIIEPPSSKRPNWDYEYACFFICDTTGSVHTAWKGFKEDLRKGCWDGANIYVMILGAGVRSA